MAIVIIGVVVFVLFTLLCIIAENADTEKATIKITDGERTLISASGDSVGEALKILFDKLDVQARNASTTNRLETIINEMDTALSNTGRASKSAVEYCCRIRLQAKEKLKKMNDEKAKAKAELLCKQRLKEQERKRKRQEAERIRAEKEKELPEHRRFIAEQRRLMTDSLRYDILQRDGFRCQLCGASAKDGFHLHVDHIIPVSKGGKTEPSNLRTLCERCNMGKRNKIEITNIVVYEHNTTPRAAVFDHNAGAEKKSSANLQTKRQYDTIDDLIKDLTEEGANLIDHRDVGGCLWIESSEKIDSLLRETIIQGRKPRFSSNAKQFKGKSAWFWK